MSVLPVRTLTTRGKILVSLLRFIFSIIHFFKKRSWQFPLVNFGENPINMGESGAIYLGYKYYYKPHRQATKGANIETHFRQQQLQFDPPSGYRQNTSCTLHAGGDLMPYRLVHNESAGALWHEVGDWFFNADLVFANLETPVKATKKPGLVPEVMLNDMYFNCPEEMFAIFSGNGKYKGYDVLSVANNHSMDMGKKGLVQTLEFLKQKGIAYCGAAISENLLNDFPVLERNGIKTAFLAYTYSLNKLLTPKGKPWMVNHLPLNEPGCDLSLIKEQCRLARKRGADFIVASLHMGNAYQAYPSSHTMELFHRVFNECGADIILGGHPHNVQPMEAVPFTDPHSGEKKQGFAIYSLADFVAYDIFTWCHLPLMLELKLSKGTRDGKPYSCLAGVQILPLYNHYDVKSGQLRFIPLRKALANVNSFDPEAREELNELEDFYTNCFLPADHDRLEVKI